MAFKEALSGAVEKAQSAVAKAGSAENAAPETDAIVKAIDSVTNAAQAAADKFASLMGKMGVKSSLVSGGSDAAISQGAKDMTTSLMGQMGVKAGAGKQEERAAAMETYTAGMFSGEVRNKVTTSWRDRFPERGVGVSSETTAATGAPEGARGG